MFAKLSSARATLVRVVAICAVVLSAGATKVASAATTTETVDFTASGFGCQSINCGNKVDPVMGSFTVTFDPTVLLIGGTTITLNNINLNPGPPPVTFDYLPNSNETFTVCSTPLCANGAANQFILDIINFASAPTFSGLLYTQTGGGQSSSFGTNTGSVSVETPATPLPAALPLFATGLGALGLLGWRRKRKARVSLLGVT